MATPVLVFSESPTEPTSSADAGASGASLELQALAAPAKQTAKMPRDRLIIEAGRGATAAPASAPPRLLENSIKHAAANKPLHPTSERVSDFRKFVADFRSRADRYFGWPQRPDAQTAPTVQS